MPSQADPEIRSLVSRYAQAVVSRDAEAWSNTWAENGCWEIMGQAPRGRAAVLAHWETLMSGIFFVFQLAGEGRVDVDPSGERATGSFPTVEFLKLAPEGPGSLMIGTYQDVYVVEAGAWKFESRRIDVQYMGPSDLSGAPMPGATS
jgi:hypothetical protein